MLKIIALDLGSHMAWAHNAARSLTWGSRLYEGDRPTRLAALQRDLPGLLSRKFDILVYETPFARGLHATRAIWGIAGVLEAGAINARIAVLDVSVATIKKFASNAGNAPKNTMILAARRMGYKGANEHEADAVCLLRYAEANFERVPGVGQD